MANDSPDNPRPHRSRWLLRLASLAMLGAVLGGFFGSIHPVIDLISHYQVHLLIGGLVLLALLALRRDWKAGAMVAMLCAITALRLAPFWIPNEPRIEGAALRVMMANVHTKNPHTHPFFDEVREQGPDLLAVIEVSERWERAIEPLKEIYPYAFVRRIQSDHRYGVAIFSRYPFEEVPLHPGLHALHFRGAAALVHAPGGPIQVLVAHPRPPTGIAASRQRDAQLTLMNEMVRAFKADTPTIVLGDLNATPWSHGYRLLIDGTTLRNTRRGSGIMGSWHTAVPSALRIPIDHILVNDEIGINSIKLGADIGSDHMPVVADLIIPEQIPDSHAAD